MIVLRIFFVILIAGPIVIGLFNYFQNKHAPNPDKSAHLNALINSSILFALAFNIIFFLQELFLVLGKKALGLTAFLYHNNHGWEGSHPMASLMQGSGALAIFVIGLTFCIFLRVIRNSVSIWKVLVIWLAFQGLLQSVPQVMIAGFANETDVGQALSGYLRFGPTLLGLIGALSIVVVVLLSISFSRPFLELAPEGIDLEKPKTRLRFLRDIAALPALIGCFLVIPFRVPPMTQMAAPFILMLFTIPWTWSIGGRIKNITPSENDINLRVRWEPILLLIAVLLVFRLILAPGIEI